MFRKGLDLPTEMKSFIYLEEFRKKKLLEIHKKNKKNLGHNDYLTQVYWSSEEISEVNSMPTDDDDSKYVSDSSDDDENISSSDRSGLILKNIMKLSRNQVIMEDEEKNPQFLSYN